MDCVKLQRIKRSPFPSSSSGYIESASRTTCLLQFASLCSNIFGTKNDQRDGSAANVFSETCPLWVRSGHLQRKTACPLYPPKADTCGAAGHVCYGPEADIGWLY